jgi:thiol-disulfide isomerase/thioredoxin
MKTRRLLLAAMLVWTIAACDGVANDTTARRGLTPGPVRLEAEGDMPSLDGAIAWLKSPPLSTAELRGKVVVVEFWTYTCVNWRRTLPYVRAWANRYRNRSAESSGGYRA